MTTADSVKEIPVTDPVSIVRRINFVTMIRVRGKPVLLRISYKIVSTSMTVTEREKELT